MRSQIKRAAMRLGLLDTLYNARLTWLNLRAGDDPLTGEVPLPPPRLRTLVGGTPDAEHFLRVGQLSADAVRSAVEAVGGSPRTILDFGCGCGRTIRHWPGSVTLHGCDANPELVHWCRENLLFASFVVNDPLPPLPYESGSFDLVYAVSVFIHLTEPKQRAWMEELTRTLAPGGILVITTHGEDPAAAALSGRDRDAYRAGKIVVTFPHAEGQNLCATYHPAGSVAAIAPSLEHVLHLPRGVESHDIHVLVKPE